MRVFKQNDQSFLAGVFGYQGKLFFSAACLLFFDLEHPETPLPEKQLWATIKSQVPKGVPFDTGMPKPVGEVLVHGACHPPHGEVLAAGQVTFTLGDVSKSLAVFGPRRWSGTGEEAAIIREPGIDASIPITWQHAFGGREYAKNPLGKGMELEAGEDDKPYRPLPNVEYADQLVGHPQDRPEPASFAPISDPTWPQRAKYTGTYDQAWLKERWPFLPDDFSMRHFNTAPKDQWHSDYFRGDESLSIEGMHPLRRLIRSHLPGLRIRCFVSQLKDLRANRKDLSNAWFRESRTNLDTVWLFPGELRGAMCFRGVMEVQDDEYRDVANVMLVTEKLDAPDHPLEYYRDMRDNWIAKIMKLDKDPAAKGKQQIADAINKINKMPKQIQAQLDKSLGKTPHAPTTPATKIAKGQARIDAAESLVGKLESMASGMRAKHGHLVHIDMGQFDKVRQNLAKQRQKLTDLGKHIQDTEKMVQQERQKAHDMALSRKKAMEARGLKADFDPEDIILGPKELRWQNSFWRVVPRWQENLRQNAALRDKLLDMGIQDNTMDRAFLGLNPEPLIAERRLWGLQPDKAAPSETHFTIPAGLVMPRFLGKDPAALHIRENVPQLPPYPAGSEDHLVLGSKAPAEAPLLLAPVESKPMVIVADPLEAFLLEQETGDLCTVLAAPRPGDDLGEEAGKLAKAAPILLVAPTAADEERADALLEQWRQSLPQAQRWPLPPQGVIHAKRQGMNLRQELRRILPPALLEELPPEPAPEITADDVKPGMAIPKLDVKGMVAGARAQANTHADALRKQVMQEAEEAKGKAMRHVEDTLRKQGLDPEKYLKPAPPAAAARDFAAMKNEIAHALAQGRAKLAAANHLTPELEQKLGSIQATSTRLLDKAAALLPPEGGINPPDWAKKLRAKHGLDPETGAGPTREKVQDMLSKGDSFHKLDLSRLDLSSLDFSGRDLSSAMCQNTVFKDCVFANANLTKAFCKEADFTGADLQGATLDSAVMHKAVLKDARLMGTHCLATLFSEADCTGADFTGADLERSLFQKSTLEKSVLARIRAMRTVFNQTKFKETRFTQADLSRAAFIKCALPAQDFRGATMENTAFITSQCPDGNFSGAEMTKVRFLKGCDLSNANFSGARLKRASLLNATLPKADFSAAFMDKAMVQECDCKGAIFERTRAWSARFNLCDLTGANMRGLDLLGGSLRKARLTQADLTAANCYGVDFYKAIVGDTIFDRANLKKSLLQRREDLLS